MSKKIISILLSLITVLNIFCCIPAKAEEVTAISNSEEFIAFTKKCASDEFSKGKKFILTNDIDMNGKEFLNAQVFCGIFEGNGHSINNIRLKSEGSDIGLFNKVTGEIRDLAVTGTIEQQKTESKNMNVDEIFSSIIKNTGISGISQNDASGASGGIAGINEGTIINCSFRGSISGRKNTGGIAGKNSGIIDSSRNFSEVSGIENTGGIAGFNEGIIKYTENTASICKEAEENAINIGGIAGINEGVTQACTNSASVGCIGFGTNTGGIAGKQSGCILSCINNGSVGGKKNVGGITGIFIPYSDIDVSVDKLKSEIENQKNKTEAQIKDDINNIRNNLTGNTSDLLKGLGIFSNSKNSITEALNGSNTSISSGISSVMDSISSAVTSGAENRAKLSDSLNSAIQNIDGNLNDTINNTGERIGEISDELNEAGDNINSNIESAVDSMNDLSDSITSNLNDFNTSILDTMDSLDTVLNTTDKMMNDMDSLMNTADSSLASGSKDITNLTANLIATLDDLRDNNLSNLTNNLSNMAKSISQLCNSIRRDFGDAADTIVKPFEELENVIEKTKDKIENIKKEIDAVKQKLKDWLESLKRTPAPLNSEENLTIGKAISDFLFPTAHAESLTNIIDTDAIREEMKKAISVDISLERKVAGEYSDNALIKYCCNCGDITGSENTGGIAGIMGVETLSKNGDIISLPSGKTIVQDMVMKAVINTCVSDGNIVSKSKNGGGIVGSSNIGIIKNCLSSGKIEITDGNFGGGIGGDLNATVLFCISIPEISGKGDLGGIAGRGSNIKQCYSLPVIEQNDDRVGSIAGSIEGTASNNYYIDENLGGISGAGYEDSAKGLSFNDMICTDKLPEKMVNLFDDDFYASSDCFPQIAAIANNDADPVVSDLLKSKSTHYSNTHFNVSFKQDGKVIKLVTKEYGETLSSDEIPEPELKNGLYPHWDRDVSKPIIRHTEINAVYDDAVMTISSDERPPVLLLEGNFSENSKIDISTANITAEFDGYEKGAAYSFEVTPEKDIRSGLKLHVYDGTKKGVAIGIVKNGQPEIIECERDGSYLLCEMASPSDFVILNKKPNTSLWVLCGIGGILSLAAITFLLTVFIKRKKIKNEYTVDSKSLQK